MGCYIDVRGFSYNVIFLLDFSPIFLAHIYDSLGFNKTNDVTRRCT